MISRIKLHHLLFILFTLMSAVPVLLLAVWVQRSALNKEVAAVEEKHLLLARNLVGSLQRYARDVESVFQLTVDNLANGRQVFGLPDLLKALQFRHVCITDSQGFVRQFAKGIAASVGSRFPDEVFSGLVGVREKAEESPGKAFFSDVMPDGAGRPTLYLVKALPDGLLGIGALSTSYFVEVQEAITFGRRGHAAIVDRQGRVLAHPNPEWRASMKDISAVKPVKEMMAGKTGVITFFSPATQSDMIAGYTTVPGVGWGAMIPQPYDELVEYANDVRLIALAIALGGIFLAALNGWWLARFLARPIQSVVASAREVAAGRLDARAQVTSRLVPGELRELAESFNRMVEDLGAQNAKTAELTARRNEVVEQLAKGASLETVLTLLVEITQETDAGMLGSVLLLDKDRKRLRFAAAPDLPDFYNEAIDGIEIGPAEGCCGAAAYLGERVVAEDVTTHPNWVKFRDLAAQADLRACWSEPIRSSSGEILGTFAMYYRQPRAPDENAVTNIRMAANLAGIAIERVRTEQALRESEEQYRAVVEDQTELICRFKPDGTYTFANDAFCHYFGKDRADLIGTAVALEERDNGNLEALRRSLRPDLPVVTREVRVVRAGGEVSWQQWTDRGIFDAEGNMTEVLSVGRDITALKQAESKLSQTHRMEALGQLAGGVAHEFNNLLQIIGGYAQMIFERSGDDPPLRELTRPIQKAVGRGADLTHRFLAFGRQQLLKPEVVDLRKVVEDTSDMLRSPLGETIELFTSVPEGIWEIFVDRSQLENAIINLAINARDAMPKGGTLKIRVQNATFTEKEGEGSPDLKAGKYVLVSVSDTGTGLAPELKERVFEPFFTTKGLAEHSGLGLSLVYGFVTQSGGHVEIESELGAGTKVNLYLPRAPLA